MGHFSACSKLTLAKADASTFQFDSGSKTCKIGYIEHDPSLSIDDPPDPAVAVYRHKYWYQKPMAKYVPWLNLIVLRPCFQQPANASLRHRDGVAWILFNTKVLYPRATKHCRDIGSIIHMAKTITIIEETNLAVYNSYGLFSYQCQN